MNDSSSVVHFGTIRPHLQRLIRSFSQKRDARKIRFQIFADFKRVWECNQLGFGDFEEFNAGVLLEFLRLFSYFCDGRIAKKDVFIFVDVGRLVKIFRKIEWNDKFFVLFVPIVIPKRDV